MPDDPADDRPVSVNPVGATPGVPVRMASAMTYTSASPVWLGVNAGNWNDVAAGVCVFVTNVSSGLDWSTLRNASICPLDTWLGTVKTAVPVSVPTAVFREAYTCGG